jgi:Spy/CpxP family protein refolding chaperone
MSNDIAGVSYSTSAASQSLYAATNAPSNANQLSPDPFLDPNGPFANLDLTAQQQQQIQQIFAQNAGSSTSQTPTQLFDQVEGVLTPQQQQTLKTDLETSSAHHHHHHGGSSDAANPLAQLDLTSAQQSQIGQIVQTAQANGTSPSTVLSQIDNVLTTSQQQQLASLFSSYTSTGSTPQNTLPVSVNTNA